MRRKKLYIPVHEMFGSPYGGAFGNTFSGVGSPPFWAKDLADGNLLAYYRTDIVDGRLIAYRPTGSTTPQVKGSLFSVAVPEDVPYTGILTSDVITAGGTAPTCAVDGTLSMTANFWDMFIHRAGVLWAYLPGINVGATFELDASGNGHHLTFTTTTIAEADDGTGTNYANEHGFSMDGELRNYGVRVARSGSAYADSPVAGATLGPELWVGTPVTITAGWTDNGDGTYTSAGANGIMEVTANLSELGARYQTGVEVVSRTSGGVSFPFYRGFAAIGYHVNPGLRYLETTAPTSNKFWVSSNAFVGTIRAISAKKITTVYDANTQIPFISVTGDSIAAGSNGTITFRPYKSSVTSGFGGDIEGVIMHRMQALKEVSYDNYAYPGKMFDWVAATGVTYTTASRSPVVWIHCGINDIINARTWAQVEADLDTIKAALYPGQILFIDEIPPSTSLSNANAALVRTWNSNLAIWCEANSAVLVLCHDDMGQIRPATGAIDDLATAYSLDGLHLTQAGVDKMAEIWVDALNFHYGAEADFGIAVASALQYPGPLNVSSTITAGTTYPAVTIKAPLGPEFQAIPEWTGETAVDLSTFPGSAHTRVGPNGTMIYGPEMNAAKIAQVDACLGA